jgi:outer membrane immunogenic protein
MHKFRTQLLASAAVLALSGAAYAADMPIKAPPPVVAPVPFVNWTGFYVGAQIGGASFDPSCTSDIFTLEEEAGCFQDFEGHHSNGSLSSSGVIGGGRIGYDWQGLLGWDRVVLGVVGQFDWTDLRGSALTTDTFDPGASLTFSERINWLASVRGRAGWAFDNVLFYATGGVAWTQIKTSVNFVPGEGDFGFSGQTNHDKTGVVAGGGFEYRVTPHVSVVGELLWYGFGSTTVSAGCCGGGIDPTYTSHFNSQDILAGTLGVNWRF